MKKFRIKETGEEVCLGNYVEIRALIDEESIEQLMKVGIVEQYDDIDLKDIIEHIADRVEGLNKVNVAELLILLSVINKKALFLTLLKEVALMLDDKYKGHIKYSEELWGISMNSGKIILLSNDKEKIRNYNFNIIAAFRSKEDAEKALEILKDLVKSLYGE